MIKLGLLDGSRPLATRVIATTGTVLDLANVRHEVEEMLRGPESPSGAGAAVRGVTIDAVGIALPGVVDQRGGCLVAAHDKYDYAIGVDLRDWAREQFGTRAVIENDARAALFGEVVHGCAMGERDAVLIILGTGIGTAALIDGRLFRGAHDHGGILGGHVTVQLDGPQCNCGNIGCAEAVASTWALEREVREHPLLLSSAPWRERLDRGDVDLKGLLDSRDDMVSRDILGRFLRAWGAAIVGLCHAYDPNLVIVSGGVMRSAEAILPDLTTYVHTHLWSSSYRPCFVTPEVPEHSVLLGLSALCDRTAKNRAASNQAPQERALCDDR